MKPVGIQLVYTTNCDILFRKAFLPAGVLATTQIRNPLQSNRLTFARQSGFLAHRNDQSERIFY
jgi:hypothetical protein